jgi:hypothetical protein
MSAESRQPVMARTGKASSVSIRAWRDSETGRLLVEHDLNTRVRFTFLSVPGHMISTANADKPVEIPKGTRRIITTAITITDE